MSDNTDAVESDSSPNKMTKRKRAKQESTEAIPNDRSSGTNSESSLPCLSSSAGSLLSSSITNDDRDATNRIRCTIVVDPVQTVARKSVHIGMDGDDDDHGDDKKPAAVTTMPANRNNMAVPLFGEDDDNGAEDEDRLSSLTEDVLYRITSFLDAPDLLNRLGLVNRWYRELSVKNQAGWDSLCERLWNTKCHVVKAVAAATAARPATFNNNDNNNNDIVSSATTNNNCECMAAYRSAVADSTRQHITHGEFCFDPETGAGTIWSFRFKESAGSDWTSVDPWYQGQPCRRMVFLRDGTMKQLQLLSSQASSSITMDESVSGDAVLHYPQHHSTSASGQQQQHGQNDPPSNNDRIELVEPPLRMTWRFLTRPMDLPTRPVGSYVRIQVGGRDVPTYAVRRSPTGNWGFVLESCWGVYGSFELPPRLTRSNAVLRRRGSPDGTTAAVWVHRDGIESRNPPLLRPTIEADMQDDSMQLTNEVQWREAFLYNVGARVLPEGDDAADEFDRFWQGL